MADSFDDFNSGPYQDTLRDGELFESYSVFFSRREKACSSVPSIEVSDEVVSNDFGNTDKKEPIIGEKLEITKQQELLKILDILRYDPVSESKLQIAPQWILNDYIQTEMRNYEQQKAFQNLFIKSLPRNTKIISSHQFVKIKSDGGEQNLNFKCRLVPLCNRDI